MPAARSNEILSCVLNDRIHLGVFCFLNRLTKKLEERREEKRKEEEQVELTLLLEGIFDLLSSLADLG